MRSSALEIPWIVFFRLGVAGQFGVCVTVIAKLALFCPQLCCFSRFLRQVRPLLIFCCGCNLLSRAVICVAFCWVHLHDVVTEANMRRTCVRMRAPVRIMRAPIPPRAYVYELLRGAMSFSMLLYAVADVQRRCGWWLCLMPHVTRHTSRWVWYCIAWSVCVTNV